MDWVDIGLRWIALDCVGLRAFSIFFLIPTIFKANANHDHRQEHPLQQDCYSIGWVFKRAAGELHVIVKAVVHWFIYLWLLWLKWRGFIQFLQ
jgi:hypothetical protein